MCWHHGGMRDSWALERERWRPSVREDPTVRVSDDDREKVVETLSRHTGEGRLTLEEFESRVEEVYASTTRGDLQHTLRDLPVERSSARRAYRLPSVPPIVVFFAIIGIVSLAPAFLWWLIPIAACTVFKRGHHYHDERHDEVRREELTSV